ncbi:LLM class flavin-dependent oxidoreductase [Actinocrinis sp.]|jgi:alkanesulfonate monooxygenase SsuD/methylene tetrahydromethanopterin reductase-like flavin-dependent oxidoreductase (luciferase family)|uniref:LLM class flavin-dependent oxidoreductase n=1 Tax=Actinocrinis sp. TaxID=1920516 RepID=UPI002DDCCDDF|nr:LLM class flavin-dependent oxidoreductase [Actinocrinis sp.]
MDLVAVWAVIVFVFVCEENQTVQIGTGLPNQVRNVRPDLIPAWAARAEQAGFSTLTTVGRYAYPGVSDTVALAAAAGATSTIGLLSAVMLAPTWPGSLLAKELAGIDGVSGGRLRVGLGVGIRPDDFVADGFGLAGRGARLERDLVTFREVWAGKEVGGGPNPAVPPGTREIPLLFGGWAPAVMDRMARWGEGYIGASLPAPAVAPSFDTAREAWKRAGREGSPRLVALAYYALDDPEAGKRNIYDYYSGAGDEFATMISSAVCGSAEAVRAAISTFEDIGADEIMFNPATTDPDEITRLADIVF